MAVLERAHAMSHTLHERGLTPLAEVISGMMRVAFGVRLPPGVELGEGTFFSSGGLGTVLHRRARVGRNCIISSCVTLGIRDNGGGAPVIEDDCFIGSGARILGDVRVGSGSIVGANCVVIHDVPPNSVVAGVPGRIVRSDISDQERARLSGAGAQM